MEGFVRGDRTSPGKDHPVKDESARMGSKIAVIGTGYVGLTTGACLAHLGHEVVCADILEEKVARLNQGHIPIVESGLEELVREGLGAERLSFVLGAPNAVIDAEFVFLCL